MGSESSGANLSSILFTARALAPKSTRKKETQSLETWNSSYFDRSWLDFDLTEGHDTMLFLLLSLIGLTVPEQVRSVSVPEHLWPKYALYSSSVCRRSGQVHQKSEHPRPEGVDESHEAHHPDGRGPGSGVRAVEGPQWNRCGEIQTELSL